jgi:hypothetical protein
MAVHTQIHETFDAQAARLLESVHLLMACYGDNALASEDRLREHLDGLQHELAEYLARHDRGIRAQYARD